MSNAEDQLEEKIAPVIEELLKGGLHDFECVNCLISISQAHTRQRLDELKEKVEARIGKVEALKEEAAEIDKDVYLYCLSEIKPILKLIDEAINDE